MVGDNHAGLAPPVEERRQCPSYATLGDRGIAARHSRVTLPTMLSIRNLLPQANWPWTKWRPAGIGLRFGEDRRTRADGTPSGFPLANRKSFLAIQPIEPVNAGRLSLPPEEDEQSPVAEAPSLVGEIAQLLWQFGL